MASGGQALRLCAEVKISQINRIPACSYCPVPSTRPLDDAPDRGLLALTTSERGGRMVPYLPALRSSNDSSDHFLSVDPLYPLTAAGRPYPSSPVLATPSSLLASVKAAGLSLPVIRYPLIDRTGCPSTARPAGWTGPRTLSGPTRSRFSCSWQTYPSSRWAC